LDRFYKSFERIQQNYDSLPKQQKKIADFLHDHFDEVVFSSITKLAAILKISEATIVRFSQALGYSGFPELKTEFARYYKVYLNPAERIERYIGEIKDGKANYASITRKEIEYLEESIATVNETIFHDAVEHICKAERVHIFGMGPNESLANYLCYRLNRFRVQTRQVSASGRNLFEKILGINPGDFAVVFAFYKPSIDYQRFMETLKEKGVEALLITDTLVPPMLGYTDKVLYAKRGPFGLFHSTIVPMAICNAMVIGVAEELGDSAVASLKELSEIRKKYYHPEIFGIKSFNGEWS
jgi:DNA-binding MurR/RpiR family transcriptional regulator